MALVPRPIIDNLTLVLQQDIAHAEFTIAFDINWDEFARAASRGADHTLRSAGMR